jgi:putative ABC transport system substrate-binding protein
MSANIGSVHGHPRHAVGQRQETTMWLSTVTLALAILVVPLAADAQPPAKVPRIAFLNTGGQRMSFSNPSFLQGLQELGYVEGRNIIIEWRCAEGRTDWARQLARELVQREVDVIVSSGRAGSLAATHATSTIPIIFVGIGDPVPELVPSLARPGGNVTGVTNIPDAAFFAKHLELLREAVPGVTRVALLLVARDPFNADRIQPVETAARAVGVDLLLVEVEGPQDFERAFSAMTLQGVGALLVSFTPLLSTHRAQLGELAAKHRLPAIEQDRVFAEQGGLMSYGRRAGDLPRRAASYVDRILKGAKPADLPVELPMKFELVINLNTAKTLGVTIPPTLLSRADEVIR